MSSYLLFLVVGLGTGAVYAALALGLVVVFKGTGIVNFAQGAMAMWGAYVFDEIRTRGELVLPVGRLPVGTTLPVAITCGVLSSALLGLLAHHLVFRPLRDAPPLAKVVASAGLMIALQAVVVLHFTADSRILAPVLPTEPVTWGGVTFSRDRLYLALVAVVLAAALWAYFRFTRWGLAGRAMAEDEGAAALAGHSPDVSASLTWMLSSGACGLVAILAAPSTSLSPVNFTLFVVPSLAVALLGRLHLIGITCAAGLALGAFQSEMAYLATQSWWPRWANVGAADALPFLLVVGALFVVGPRLPTRGAVDVDRLPRFHAPEPRPLVVGALTVAGVAALALTGGSYRFGIITSMIAALVTLSLVVLTGFVGQISLAQAAFAGVGGFAVSKLTTDLGVPFPFSVLGAGLAAAAVGVVVGLPALRIRGAQLAVVTLAAAVAVERFVFRNPFFSPVGGNPVGDPSLLGVDLSVRSAGDPTRLAFGLMVLVVLALGCLGVANLARSDAGRAFLAVRANERAAAAAGIDVARTKLAAFALASFLAGVGGALVGYSRGQLSADSFGVFVGVSFLASAYLGGITSVGGALIAGMFAPLGIGHVLLDRNLHLGRYYFLLSGTLLVLTAVLNPNGIAGSVREQLARRRTAHA